jgi:hypothetical protein
MRDVDTNTQTAIAQAAQQWGRKYYTLTCWTLDERKYTYTVMADNRQQAVQSCLSDNPQSPMPYIIGNITLHIPIF